MQIFVQVGQSWWTGAVVDTINVRYMRRSRPPQGPTPTAYAEMALATTVPSCADRITRVVMRTPAVRLP